MLTNKVQGDNILLAQCAERKCRNWQTSKTKDLVVVTPCGFKSHLPHYNEPSKKLGFLLAQNGKCTLVLARRSAFYILGVNKEAQASLFGEYCEMSKGEALRIPQAPLTSNKCFDQKGLRGFGATFSNEKP